MLGTVGLFAEAQRKKDVFLSAQHSGQGFTGTIENLVAEDQYLTKMTLQELAIPCVVLSKKNRTTIQGGIHVFQHIHQAEHPAR
jgi:hypothetical protein